ncbi:hypothetical protein Bca4012_010815 [Brassica carinata]
MSSRRKTSTKSRHDRAIPDGSSSQHNDVMPKVEFEAHSINHEEIDAYWVTKGEVKPPRPGMWTHSPFRANLVDGCLDACRQEAHMAQFKAETADKKIARLRDELECSRFQGRGSTETDVVVPTGEEEEMWSK